LQALHHVKEGGLRNRKSPPCLLISDADDGPGETGEFPLETSIFDGACGPGDNEGFPSFHSMGRANQSVNGFKTATA
jgi:hypothetical protein